MQTGTAEDVAKYSKRTVRVTREHNDDCKRLLQLMGIPIVEVSPVACFAGLVLAAGLVLIVVPGCSGMNVLLIMTVSSATRPLRLWLSVRLVAWRRDVRPLLPWPSNAPETTRCIFCNLADLTRQGPPCRLLQRRSRSVHRCARTAW